MGQIKLMNNELGLRQVILQSLSWENSDSYKRAALGRLFLFKRYTIYHFKS